MPKGWPHASLLSAGDMLAMPSGRIRFVVFAQSTTTANLVRDGRVTITLSLDGGMCELRMRCRRLAHASPDPSLAFFEAELVEVRIHKAPYATVSGRGYLRAARAAVGAAAVAKADRCDAAGGMSDAAIDA